MQIKEVKELFGTKWLAFKEGTYLNKENQEAKWTWVSRKNGAQIVTAVCCSKTTGKYLLISQPRVPVNKIVIEFPAGLIDKGETPEMAGLRELKEETGYDGTVIKASLFVVKSAGLSDEATSLVEIDVDEKAVGKTEMETTEDIQSFWMNPQEFKEMTDKLDWNKYIVDSHVWFYFQGLFAGSKSSPKKSPKKTTAAKKKSTNTKK